MSLYWANIQQGGALPYSIWDGLLSYWSFSETTGTVIADSKGTNDATMNVGSHNSGGKNGYCWYNINISYANPLNLGNVLNFDTTDTFSINCWVKRRNASQFHILISKMNPNAPYNGWGFKIRNTGYLEFELFNSFTVPYHYSYSITNASTANNTTVWYMCTVTYDGSGTAGGSKLYLNGTLQTQEVTTDTMSTAYSIAQSYNCNLGGQQQANQTLKGYLDEAAVWDRVITQDDVTALYNAGAGLFY